jgi:hypothetical protein
MFGLERYGVNNMAINMNNLAKAVTLEEGKKISLPIGQVKEVIKLTLIELAKFEDEEILKMLKKYKVK